MVVCVIRCETHDGNLMRLLLLWYKSPAAGVSEPPKWWEKAAFSAVIGERGNPVAKMRNEGFSVSVRLEPVSARMNAASSILRVCDSAEICSMIVRYAEPAMPHTLS